ncbi:MAG: hypothetical protein AB1430_22250 [Pseudomonadota bacterium]
MTTPQFAGIINGLLTGGILVGKICQALGGGGSGKTFHDNETGITVVGDVSAGGVKFFRRTEKDGQSMVYAFNSDTKADAMVTVPNEHDAGGATFIIEATKAVPFEPADNPLVSPAIEVVAGPTDVPPALQTSLGGGSLLKLAFTGLQLGKTVNVGGFRITCNTTQLVVITTQLTATALTYMLLNSDKGVSATNLNPIAPKPPKEHGTAGDIELHFDVDFAALGFDMQNDTLSGQLTLATPTTGAALHKLSKAPSRPLHPVEKEFFSRLARGLL